MPADREVPLILGRPFLATGDAVIRVRDKTIMLQVGGEQVTLDMFETMKQPEEEKGCGRIDVIEECIAEFEETEMQERSNKHEAEWFDLCEFEKFNFRETKGFDSSEVTKFDLNNLGSNEVDEFDLCVFERFNFGEDDLSEAIRSLCEAESFELCEDNPGEIEKDSKKEENPSLKWEIKDSDADWKCKLEEIIENVFASFENYGGHSKKKDKVDPEWFKMELPNLCRMLEVQNKSGEKDKAEVVERQGLPIAELLKEEKSFGEAKPELKLEKAKPEKDLKEPPDYLKHAFLDNNNTQPVISSQLEPDRETESLEVLTDYEEVRDRRFFKYVPPEQVQFLGTCLPPI